MAKEVTVPDDQRDISELLIDWMALSEGLAEEHADWLPFLVFGMPFTQIAKIFGCDKSNITHTLKRTDNGLARAVAQGRRMVKRQLHYIWLDQKAVQAWRNIDYFLQIDPFEEVDGKPRYDVVMQRLLVQERAKMSRFVIQQLGLHVQRYEVAHTTPSPMFMGDTSLAKLVVEKVTFALNADPDERDPGVIASRFRDIVAGEYEVLEPDEDEKELEAPYDRRGDTTSKAWEGKKEG